MADKRFKVALSFPGEHRAYIKEVAEHLSFALGKDNVFYDDYYKDELARPNLDDYLTNIYKNESGLVVYFLCEDYSKKKWCRLEWRVIKAIIFDMRDDDLMQFRFDNFPIEGTLAIDGYIEILNNTHDSKETSEFILKRLRKNETAIATRQNADYDAAKEKVKELEKEIADLKAGKHTPEITQQIDTLTREKETLNQQLQQKDEFIAQQEKTKKELKKSLEAEQGKDELKKQALIAVEEKNYDKAEDLLKEAAQERMQKVAEDFYQLGNIKELKLEYAEALKYYELAAKIPPNNTDYLSKAGQLCYTLGFLDTALYYFETGLAIDIQADGEENENVARNYSDIGLIWSYKGNWSKAIDHLEKSLKIILKLYGVENNIIATIYNNLGTVWADKGDLDTAIDYYQKALK